MTKQLVEVYIGLGGNIGNVNLSLVKAIDMIKTHSEIHGFKASNMYQTSPVSPIPQNDFLNCVCRFQTTLDPHTLLLFLQEIEQKLGKVDKPKEAPRPIDCDILLYGSAQISTPHLEIPHPKWKKRLFVLIPMRELTKSIMVSGTEEVDLDVVLAQFQNTNDERVGVVS